MISKLPTSFRDISFDYKLKKFMEGMPYPIEEANFLWKGAFRPDEKRQVLSQDLKQQLNSKKDYFSLEEYARDFNGVDMLNKLLFLDTKVYMQDDILAKVDRMSMANSLEVRVPFLDHTVAEFAASLPLKYKLNGLKTKCLLKKVMKNKLPKEIVNRKKKGFGIPFAIWVAEELLKNFVLDVFSESRLKEQEFFQVDVVRQIVVEHLSKKQDNRKLIWTLLVFLTWFEDIKSVKIGIHR